MSTVTPRPTDAGHPGGRPPSLHSIIPPDPPPAYDPASAIAYTTALSLAASGPSQPRARSRHAAILLSRSDKLRIIGFPFCFVALVDAAVMQEWKAGIQEQKAPDRQSWEWKLNGKPWTGKGSDTISSRRLIAHVFFILQVNGWHLTSGADLSSTSTDKGAIMLRSGPPSYRQIFSIVFNEDDKIRLIDAPTEAIREALESAIKDTRPFGIQDSGETERGVYQLRLRGNPWSGVSPVPPSHKRNLTFSILSAMEDEGCDTWVFAYSNT
ncbi:uncharacterized protein MKK02DRAFT_39982 [Dioszegia hungarica]|uniref:Uncharacterized protein n=1 Tax=Dioszegia hungarica TaxID=4972 RepID=A0AA38LXH7_9TREE|nr:uncharacterized protein MKK02DRAFT_39982 [Dioszegia hungarica]KAI9639660.1 hypothetical protein MKK02DRAFT_39982 [Dioszegia hungarica]